MHMLPEVWTAMIRSNVQLSRTRVDHMHKGVRIGSDWYGYRNSMSLLTTLQMSRWAHYPLPDALSFQQTAAKYSHGIECSSSILKLAELQGSLLATYLPFMELALLLRHSR